MPRKREICGKEENQDDSFEYSIPSLHFTIPTLGVSWGVLVLAAL